ncbi:EAL and HDOD domain-containing protein [Herbaspirillum sp. GCM10030257]|uniref:EAL and HDOD domain-containing protein n=1 Tax=Herbaspirillum sp. GCM10030257 TaxID=3273393 RepID=UPI0036157DD8
MMSISVTFNSSHKVLLGSDFFMARRPVVDRSQRLVAHELMFSDALRGNEGSVVSGEEQPASASVIADVCEYGLARVIGDQVGILYIDAEALMSDIFGFLPPQQIILELANMPECTSAILEKLSALRGQGFRLALTLNAEMRDIAPLLPLIEGVRVDVGHRTDAELAQICSMFKAHDKMLLAEHVESMQAFRRCADFGFDFFQGYFFSEPQILAGKKLSASQLSVIELMALLASDVDDALIEQSIKGDVALGLNLLRFANTPAISAHRIESLRQALIAVGRNQLQRWMQVLLYAEGGIDGSTVVPLMAQATTRGRLMELVAQKLRPGNRSIADTVFTVGIMSLMDTLFSMQMTDILKQIPVVDEVAAALLHREGYFGKLLAMAEQTEWRQRNNDLLLQSLAQLNLSCKDLYLLQLATFEWSDKVTRSLHK